MNRFLTILPEALVCLGLGLTCGCVPSNEPDDAAEAGAALQAAAKPTEAIASDGEPGTSPDIRADLARVREWRSGREWSILTEFRDFLALPNVADDDAAIRKNAEFLLGMLERRGIEGRLLEAPSSGGSTAGFAGSAGVDPGVATAPLPAGTPGGGAMSRDGRRVVAPPVVYGEWRSPGADRTVIFYAHYDGQPVEPADWAGDPWTAGLRAFDESGVGPEIPWPSGAALENGAPGIAGGADSIKQSGSAHAPAVPFVSGAPAGSDTTAPSRSSAAAPQVLPAIDGEWRLHARGASDDKGTIVALLAAVDALRALSLRPSVNVIFFFEGEEEKGSPHLDSILRANADLLRADGLFLCDGPVHQTRRPQLLFGARGVIGLEMTVYGPDRALHSGHYGNWAPNPAAVLSDLVARMRDPDGRILIPGFYDDVREPTAAERQAVEAAPRMDEDLRRSFGLAWTEADGARLDARILLPAMNVRGLRSGNVGATAQNAIPTEASASIDFRLVPDQRPEQVRERVEGFLSRRGFAVVERVPTRAERQSTPRLVRMEWDAGYPSGRTRLDGSFARSAIRAAAAFAGDALVTLPTAGGSIPVHLFQERLGCPVILLPIANHDNNQHGPNENLRLRNLWDGIELHAALLLGL